MTLEATQSPAAAGRLTGRRMQLVMSSTILPLFFGEGDRCYRVVKDALPADAVVVDCRMEFGGRNVVLLVESESFPETLPGGEYPAIVPYVTNAEDRS
jgi:hypothetical protein